MAAALCRVSSALAQKGPGSASLHSLQKPQFHANWPSSGLRLALKSAAMARKMQHAYWLSLATSPQPPQAPRQGGDYFTDHMKELARAEVMGGEEVTTIPFICGLDKSLSPPCLYSST